MENKNQDWRDFDLDQDEVELLESIENKEWKSVGNIGSRQEQLRSFFIDENEQEKIINLKLKREDLEIIIKKSSQYGINYKELIEKVVHNFAIGKMVL